MDYRCQYCGRKLDTGLRCPVCDAKRNTGEIKKMTRPTKEQIEQILSVVPVEDGMYVIPQIIT